MALFVFLTEECRSDAQTYGLMYDVEKLIYAGRGQPELERLRSLPSSIPCQEEARRAARALIASRQSVGDHAVVVLLAVMIRGQRAYESEFAVDPVGYGRQHFDRLIEPEVLAAVRW